MSPPRSLTHTHTHTHTCAIFIFPPLPLLRRYRCKSCDFDCCVKCFLKKDISKAEGQVRGDKGLKNVEEVKTSAYAWRAIGFCRPHWYYIAIAVVCLLLNIGVSLLMPNYQGHIIDCIVERDHKRFKYGNAPPSPPSSRDPQLA